MSKRILFIVNNLGVGGAERLVIDDINEMILQGIDVYLLTLREESKHSLYSQLNLPRDKTQCIRFKGLLDIRGWGRLIRAIKNIKPDLAITQLWFENTVGRIACFITGTKLISFEQNVYDTVKTRKMFFADYLLQGFSKMIIAVSGAVKKSLISHGIKENRIDILHNSINISAYEVSFDRSKIRKEIGVHEEVFVCIFAGRLIHQKAVDVLIKSFADLGNDSRLLIIGQGKDEERLRELVKEKGLTERVKFLGIRKDMPQILLSSDCFVLPSRYEGLPLILLEALAAGLPVVVSDFAAAKEVIVDGENGLMVPREDIGRLTDAMKRIKNDPALRERLGKEAKRTAQKFSIEAHVRAILRYT